MGMVAHDIIPTLRRLRQDVLSSLESSRIAWSLVWGPVSEGKGRTGRIPWHAWWSSTVHSSQVAVNCQVSHPTSSRQSWLSTSEYHTLHLCQPQLQSCQLPSMGLLYTQTASWTAGCGHVSSQTDWAAGLCLQARGIPKHTTVECF